MGGEEGGMKMSRGKIWADKRLWLAAAATLSALVWYGFEIELMGFFGVVMAFALVAFAATRAAALCYNAGRLQQMALSAIIAVGCIREVVLVQSDKGPPLTLGWAIMAFVAVGVFWHMGLARKRSALPIRQIRIADEKITA